MKKYIIIIIVHDSAHIKHAELHAVVDSYA